MPDGPIPKVPIRLEVDGHEQVHDPLNKPFHIGRAPENDLVIEDQFVSLKHLVLEPTAHGWLARDLGSSNGTILLSPSGGNGGKLREKELRPGWGLRIGETTLWLRPLAMPVVTAGQYGMVGSSPPMEELYKQIKRAAKSDFLHVLLTGETGTGKELVAKAIHVNSARKDKPYVKRNCANFGSGTAESQLFGHVRGAFTGATTDSEGLFEVADGGTLFLDEVHRLPGDVQTKLLRVIETGEFTRLGETRVRKCDVRIIAATNQDLPELIADGKFAEDLYYRLNGFPIRLPALRERLSDIPSLARYLLAKVAGGAVSIAPEAMVQLEAFDWPGNVRVLDQVVRRAIARLGDDEVVILPEHLEFNEKVSKPGAKDDDLEYVRIAGREEGDWVQEGRYKRYLAHGKKLRPAAKELGRDPDTVAKSVKKGRSRTTKKPTRRELE